VPPQVQDRVHDQLPRPMERHLAAALHTEQGQRWGVRQEQQVLLAAASACVYVRGKEFVRLLHDDQHACAGVQPGLWSCAHDDGQAAPVYMTMLSECSHTQG